MIGTFDLTKMTAGRHPIAYVEWDEAFFKTLPRATGYPSMISASDDGLWFIWPSPVEGILIQLPSLNGTFDDAYWTLEKNA